MALISGLALSIVAEYYSILGLISIFSAAAIPVAVMGIALGLGKITATLWLKQNWSIASFSIKTYLMLAILVLMLITSMGIFGFLSKAHSDQSLVSGDVQSKIAIYDEKIKTEKENIEANRKALKQMDEGVDQVLGRSTSETGADKAVALRRSQQKERARLQAEISQSQKSIAELNDARAPIAAEVRKVEAEVGPIKYIASFVYGKTDTTILEKAVTWVIVILIVVFDPLAVILLLASQTSFKSFRDRRQELSEFYEMNQAQRDYFKNDEPEIPNDITLKDINMEANSPIGTEPVVNDQDPTVANTGTSTSEVVKDFDIKDHPYLFNVPKSYHPPGIDPVGPQVYREDEVDTRLTSDTDVQLESIEHLIDSIENSVERLYIQNEEQQESDKWTKASTATSVSITEDEYQQTGMSRQELTLNEWIEKIKSGKIRMVDVPKHLLLDIRARM